MGKFMCCALCIRWCLGHRQRERLHWILAPHDRRPTLRHEALQVALALHPLLGLRGPRDPPAAQPAVGEVKLEQLLGQVQLVLVSDAHIHGWQTLMLLEAAMAVTAPGG